MSHRTAANEAAQIYRRREIETADPIGLVVCTLDLACENLVKARAAMAAEQPAIKGRHIDRVSRAVALLQSSLDIEQGEVAQNLDRLYIYIQQRIAYGHRHNDDSALGEIAGHLSEMAAAWREAARRLQSPAEPRAELQQAVNA